jgi:hypothetical protein
VGEHLLCKQGVVGSIPSASTSALLREGGCERGWGFASDRKGRVRAQAWDVGGCEAADVAV